MPKIKYTQLGAALEGARRKEGTNSKHGQSQPLHCFNFPRFDSFLKPREYRRCFLSHFLGCLPFVQLSLTLGLLDIVVARASLPFDLHHPEAVRHTEDFLIYWAQPLRFILFLSLGGLSMRCVHHRLPSCTLKRSSPINKYI